eukprot:4143430-Amphidinium_carterae.1
MNVSLGGVWHGVRTHNAFAVGDRAEEEDLSHIVGSCGAPPRSSHSNYPHHRHCGVAMRGLGFRYLGSNSRCIVLSSWRLTNE